jgi:PAS domain S-box-containing protein
LTDGPRTPRHPLLFTAALFVAAIVVRLLLEALVGRSVPYLSFLLAIGFAAWFYGFLAGLYTTVATTALLFVWFRVSAGDGPLDPRGTPLRLLGSAIFTVVVALLADLVSRARRTERDALAHMAAHEASARDAELLRARLAAIVESSQDAVISKDLDGVVTSWNQGAQRLFGYAADEIIGAPITRIIPPERLPEEEAVLERIRKGEAIAHFDTVRVAKDGSAVDVSVAVSPIKDAAGRIVGASKIARDIRERRRADLLRDELLSREQVALEEAMSARDRLEFLANVSGLLTSSLDYEETLDRAVHIALPRLGDYCTVLVQNERGQLRHVASGHVNREKEPVVRELAIRVIESQGIPSLAASVMQSGETRIVASDMIAAVAKRLAPTVDPTTMQLAERLQPFAYMGVALRVRGRIIGAMSFATAEESRREYTSADQELAEEFARRVSLAVENARLFRQADELNRLKDEFLATLSHEMRTPLSAVLGWAKMLAGGQLSPEKTTHAIAAIERNANAQAKIVDDILDVARGTGGNVRLDMKSLDITGVIHRGLEAVAPAAAAKNIAINVHADGPINVVGDADRLQQVMWNLLSNAVKFTPANGRVAVGVKAADGFAVVDVTDTGIGIDAEFLPFVFDKFRQADGSFTRRFGGLGLGLAIARHLIELHGGSIAARSEGEGTGASFVVRLPLAA